MFLFDINFLFRRKKDLNDDSTIIHNFQVLSDDLDPSDGFPKIFRINLVDADFELNATFVRNTSSKLNNNIYTMNDNKELIKHKIDAEVEDVFIK